MIAMGYEQHRIVITGVGLTAPNGNSLPEFRQNLLDGLKKLTSFNAGGILGATNVGGRVPTGCFVMMKVAGGKFVRAEPAAADQLSCGTQNLG